MRGTRVSIPFLGMNNQLLDDQSVDGLCDSIINLKPKGSEDRPYWVPFEKINTLKNGTNENFTYEFGVSSITDAFWQVRNTIGEFAEDTDGSLKRLLVLCQNNSRKCIDIVEPETWTVVKTQALPQEGTYNWSCTRLDEVTIILINKDKVPFQLFYLQDDTFIPQGWPEMPAITFDTVTDSFTSEEVTAGNTTGVLRKDVDQWFLVNWAFRLFDGTYVKHNSPILVKVDSGLTTESIQPRFTLVGYSAVENLLIEQPFWKGLISGISVHATIPRTEEQTALDDGAFFEIGYWPWIDRLPEDQWTSAVNPNIITVEKKSDAWPTGKNIGIDNFTHHRFSGRVSDTYNKRLLLGGSSVDFAMPRIKTNASLATVPGGVYSDYMNYASGSSSFTNLFFDSLGNPLGSEDDPNFSYSTSLDSFAAQFIPKAGREFKTVTIVESNPGDADVNPPGGPTGLPSAAYTANINGLGQLNLEIDTEETDFPSGGQFAPEIAFMKLRVEIGPVGGAADQSILFTVSPAGNSAPYVQFSNVEVETTTGPLGPAIYHIITIKTEVGTYKRILAENLPVGATSVTLPEVIWYPDRRAVLYELVVLNGSTYELAMSKQLVRHPESNYSYVILPTAEQTYTLGDSLTTASEPNLSENDKVQYVPNRIQASISGTAYIFDPAASYRVGNRENDTILGFGINLNPTSEGQAGQYPVYAFSDKGVWALEQTGDPEIAFGRITPVSNFNGINNPYAITNAGSLIIATDNKYIYALAGLESTRIDEAIANDPDYKEYLKQIRIGYHRASDYEEVIFSNPFYDYSLCYNLKYKVWYKATERFKFFFYDYPELMGLTVDNVLKDFSDKDISSPVTWSLTTRVLQFQEPYVYKRLYPSYLRMRVKQPLQENAEDYSPVRVQLKGYRDSPSVVYSLYDQSVQSDQVLDYRIYNQYGSMYAYRLILSGTSMHQNGQIQGIDGDIEYRYQDTRRRLDCSAQYLYANGETGISICNCEGGGGTDAYFPYTGVATESIVVTHNLDKIPSVFVTDMDGYLIEVGVQLLFVEDQPDLKRIRLTFDDPVPFKAFFN